MASIPHFPAEIILSVLALADKKTLAACCLVEKAWLPIARECLYGTLKFRDSEFTETFLQSLPNLSPDVAAYVRRIELGSRQGSLATAPDRIIRRLTDHFRHVKELTLLYLDFIAFDDLFVSLASLQKVEVLSVAFTTFKDSIDLLRLVSSFPALTTLALQGCDFTDLDAALSQPPIPFPVNLRKGKFSYCHRGQKSVIRWFLDNARSVTSLDLPDLEAHQFKQFGTDLKNIGDDLEHFSLVLDYDEFSNSDFRLLPGRYQHIPLAYNTKLRSLSFKTIGLASSGMSKVNRRREEEKRDNFSWFITWLRTVSSFHLARISLDFDFYDLDALSQFRWADVDAILSAFPSLREIGLRFTPYGPGWHTADEVVQYVKDALPLLCSKQVWVDIEILESLYDDDDVSDSDESGSDSSDDWGDDSFDSADFSDP